MIARGCRLLTRLASQTMQQLRFPCSCVCFGIFLVYLVFLVPPRSDGMNAITEFFGLDQRDRTAWEFAQHLNAPRMRLEYKHDSSGRPQLTLICHGALSADCPRAILFDGVEKKGVPVRNFNS